MTRIFSVVVNHAGQYSIWPADRAVPPGWTTTGKVGEQDECLGHIDNTWAALHPCHIEERR